MSLQRILPYVLILALVFAGISCNDDWIRSDYDTTVKWEGGIVAPLAYGNLTLKDLLERFNSSGYVSEDSTGFLYAAYSVDTVISAPDILELPDQEFIQVFFRVDTTIPGWALGSLGDTITFDQEKGFEFARTGDERIDSVHIKAGEMSIYIRSSIEHEGILTIKSDHISLNGMPYNEVIPISDPSGNFEQTISIPMAGSSLYLDNSVPDSTSIHLDFVFDLINSGNDILSSQEVQIINSFHNLEFSSAYGYLGLYDSLLIDRSELEFNVLEGVFEGEVSLANPQLNITTTNSIGLPFGIGLEDLEARFRDGSSTAITITPNPIIIPAPTIDMVGESVPGSAHIDSTNSNINVAATTELTGFQYSVRVLGNPEGTQDNFITDDAELEISIEGLIPLNLKIKDVVLQDTFDFKIPLDEDFEFGPDNVDYMLIQVEINNSLPLDLGIQVYFVDTTRNWLVLDSLFGADNEIVSSGVLDDNGRVIQATPKTTAIELSRSQIENVMDANKMLMKAFVNTTKDDANEPRNVKFYSDYSLYFKLGTRLELNVTTTLKE